MPSQIALKKGCQLVNWHSWSKKDTTLSHRTDDCNVVHIKFHYTHNTNNLGCLRSIVAKLGLPLIKNVPTETELKNNYGIKTSRHLEHNCTLAHTKALEAHNMNN